MDVMWSDHLPPYPNTLQSFALTTSNYVDRDLNIIIHIPQYHLNSKQNLMKLCMFTIYDETD